MGTSFNENVIDEIKSRCNIVDVIGRVVALKRAGSNYKGLCPFHNEKTPSFVVSEQKQIFTCFGCGATGDVIKFVEKYENLDFVGAVEKLAAEYNIDVKNNFGNSEKRDKLYEINREAARFFFRSFYANKNRGYDYMKNRGIEPLILKKFGIGYADEKWDSLYIHLRGLGFDDGSMLDLGLISKGKDGRYYDKFRDRVIFPIINTNGKVIGFGGRAIGDAMPKYLNSAESQIFLKKNNLFGLNLAKQDISKENRAILVEGYMDMISLYQAGIRNVAASLGTALTENQAKLLKRYTQNVVLSYDADSAGQAAALRGLDILQHEGCKVRVLHVSDGKDPDEFVKKNGRKAFSELIENALPLTDYKLEAAKKGFDLTSTEGKVDYIRKAAEILRTLSPVEAEVYIKKLADTTGISESAIRLEYNGNDIQHIKRSEKHRYVHDKESSSTEVTLLEKYLIKLSLLKEEYLDKISSMEYSFDSRAARNIIDEIKRQHVDEEMPDIRRLQDSLDIDESRILQDVYDNLQLAVKEELVYEDCMRQIELKKLTDRQQELLLCISMADENDEENRDNIEKLSRELCEIQAEIQNKKDSYGR